MLKNRSKNLVRRN